MSPLEHCCGNASVGYKICRHLCSYMYLQIIMLSRFPIPFHVCLYLHVLCILQGNAGRILCTGTLRYPNYTHFCHPILHLRTATATQYVMKNVVKSLHMSPLVSIHLSPNRSNIHYSIIRVKQELITSFQWLVDDLRRKRTMLPRVAVL